MHYWPPWEGPESPLADLFWEMDENLGENIDFVIVESGFIHPDHSPDEMPLTVAYRDGMEVDSAPFDIEEIQSLAEGL